jgi:hypothetical protein
MIKNVTVADLALVELLRGATDAPVEVLRTLGARGYVALVGHAAALTRKGRRRAEKLKDGEHDLRLLFAPTRASGGPPLRTDGGCSLYVSGGSPVRIRG